MLKFKHKLPAFYPKLSRRERKQVREQYIEEQQGLCFYCGCLLNESPPKSILNKRIDWSRFPGGIRFLRHPIHLQHCHKTGLTEGAVHAYCNAVLWQYEGR